MALGGGSFVTKDKILPGSYINVVSKASAVVNTSVSGAVAMPLMLDWGASGEIFTVTNEDFFKNSLKIFGYSYDHEKMKGLRDLFKNAAVLHAYRLSVSAAKASNTYATAKYSGIRGNNIKIAISVNIDNGSLRDVITYFDSVIVDKQIVASSSSLKDNDFVIFNKSASLTSTAGINLSGGTNGTADANEYIKFLTLIEGYSFNILTVDTTNAAINALFISFTKRMRDEYGIKFQAVLYDAQANYEGVISLNNFVTTNTYQGSALVYWFSGALSACNVNGTVLNKIYDGEFEFFYETSSIALKDCILEGNMTLHKSGDSFVVLADINSLTDISGSKGADFKNNQTIRILDYLSNNAASLFNNVYLGRVPNNEAGRVSLWNDIVSVHKELYNVGALENFDAESIKVEKGTDKGSVVVSCSIIPVNAMSKLYATIIIL